tara:strand:+ start:1356 stop:1979 length:624 start_codon:yes stop_codon:yes gene_type:complete
MDKTILALFLLLGSNQNETKEHLIDTYNVIKDSVSLTEDIEVLNSESEIFISTDSIFEIKIYKTVSRLWTSYSKMQLDFMQYSCIEFCRTHTALISFPSYRMLSDATPETYLSIKVIDTNFKTFSNWFLYNSNSFKHKFYFAFDVFKNFNDSAEIALDYDRFYKEFIMTKFNLSDIKTKKRYITLYISNWVFSDLPKFNIFKTQASF